MLIRKAEVLESITIAQIHIERILGSFLGSLGLKFLATFYKSIVTYQEGILLVVENKGEIIGFIAGVTNTRSFGNYFLKKNFIKAIFLLLPKVFYLRNILEDLKYARKNWEIPLPNAEILSMAVKAQYCRNGIGSQLFRALVSEFQKIGVREFKIILGNNLQSSQRFHQKMGCAIAGELKLHRVESSTIYVFKG